jgi:phosphoribosylaminoimidazole-succinocarboxamide synthase
VTPLPHLYTGKVRDLYDAGDGHLLMVASDRVSAFDVVMEEPIPDKGRVLTGISAFWFARTEDIIANHVVSSDPADFPPGAAELGDVAGRAMLVRATEPVRMECIVRGFLFGSAWREYCAGGTVNGAAMPGGMVEAERLPEPIFTPSTKAEAGHDLPLTRVEGIDLVGRDLYERLERDAIEVYRAGVEYAAAQGIVLADTKLEFGLLDGELVLIDELLTPDSSRYWPADAYQPGHTPPSFDKQYLREYLDTTGWDHTPPPPALPAAVVDGIRSRYVEAYERLTDRAFGDWFGGSR